VTEEQNDNINVRLILNDGEVSHMDMPPEDVDELKSMIDEAVETHDWSGFVHSDQAFKMEYNERLRRPFRGDYLTAGVRLDTVCAYRFRPYQEYSHDFIPDRKFVQLQFDGGGFINAVCSAEQADELIELVESDLEIITWTAGSHEILFRLKTLSGYEIDVHTRKQQRNQNGGNRQSGRNQGGGQRFNKGRDHRPRVASRGH
jgi:hypothetical protein